MERTIKVTGKGNMSLRPDTVRLLITQTGLLKDYTEAVKESTVQKNVLTDVLSGLGFDRKDLKTLKFDVGSEFESYQAKDKSWQRRLTGFRFTHRMKLEFPDDKERFGKVLYALAHCPGTPEFRIEYTVSDPEAAKNELLAKAVADSMAKAGVLSDAAGVKLGRIMDIDYSWGEINFVSRPMEDMEMLRCCEDDYDDVDRYDIDIEADDINVSDTVTVVWEIA